MATEAEARQQSDALTLVAFSVAVVVAGGNAPAIRYVSCSSCELDPFWGAAMRFLLASSVMAGIAAVMRVPLPRSRALVGATVFGVLQYGAGFGLIYLGLVRSPAGLGQVVVALVPLLTLGLALAHRQEHFRWAGLIGGVCSLAGIAVVFHSGLDLGVPFSSMLVIFLGSVCWAEALVDVKAFPRVHPAALNAVAMAVGGVALLLVSLLSGEEWAIPEAADTWLAQAYLVLPGSVGVFWLYVVVARAWAASAASYQLVVVPLVTVPVSAWLHDETITWSFAAGSVLVLAGVYVGALKPAGQR